MVNEGPLPSHISAHFLISLSWSSPPQASRKTPPKANQTYTQRLALLEGGTNTKVVRGQAESENREMVLSIRQ